MRVNWFICLSYPRFDVLFPKEHILSSSYIKEDSDTETKIINFDEIINPMREEHQSLQSSGKNRTQLEIRNTQNVILQTSIIPDLISADLSEFRVLGGELGQALLGQGFISARFLEKKIQYLFDINAILKNI